ncbi:MAG: histidine kinase, partial [Chloroflexi bacterium]|nr:histidine kinase [Chloroflexota bacterium]
RGAGLGLCISRGIVEAHGGRVWAESNPGRGSTFMVTLPIVPVEAAVVSPSQISNGRPTDP